MEDGVAFLNFEEHTPPHETPRDRGHAGRAPRFSRTFAEGMASRKARSGAAPRNEECGVLGLTQGQKPSDLYDVVSMTNMTPARQASTERVKHDAMNQQKGWTGR